MSLKISEKRCSYCEGILFTDDIFYVTENKCFCNRCLKKADSDDSIKPYIMTDQGDGLQVIDSKTTADKLFRGLYAVSLSNGILVIINRYSGGNEDDKRLEWINSKLSENSMVLEKNGFGIVIRFSKAYDKNTFDADDEIHRQLIGLIDIAPDTRPPQVLCNGDKVEGIACARTRFLSRGMYEFTSCNGEFEIIDTGYFRGRSGKSALAKAVAEKLEMLKPSDMLDYFKKRLIGQDKEIRKVVYLFFEYFVQVASGKNVSAVNWLLTAPSGCGKTEVYRVLRDFCKDYDIPIPVKLFDLSQYTETGYRGADVDDMVQELMTEHKETDGVAICFLDEADKKCLPSYNSMNIDTNSAMQSNLLTLIEGREIVTDGKTFNSGKTMFVFMGAFQAIRDEKQKKVTKHATIGFSGQQDDADCEKVIDSFYDDITQEEIIEYGMQEELAGRLTQVINLHKLSEKDMKVLIKEKARLISEEQCVQIEVTAGAIDSLLEISYSNLGVRNVMNRLRSLVTNTLSEYYYDDNFDKSEHKIVIQSAEKTSVTKQRKKKKLEFSA